MNTTAPHHRCAPRRPVLRYLGGKAELAPWIVAHLPPHRVYVEPFGGAASVLLCKAPSPVEVYNDAWGRLVNLFRVLRDEATAERLVSLLQLTPYARAEYDACRHPCPHDPVEDARRLVVRSWMGVGSNALTKPSGFRFYARVGKRVAMEWAGMPGALRAVCERLRGVLVEGRDAVDVLAACDAADACHYVDPPYLHETRGANRYAVELGDVGLTRLRGAVVLSGYPSTVYDAALTGWHRVERRTLADDRTGRVECLWMNAKAHDALGQRSLFDAHAIAAGAVAPLPSASN